MSKRLKVKALAFALICVSILLVREPDPVAVEMPKGISIFGFVKEPLNFTYAELLSFPTISEVATLECVDRYFKVTYNWTGVPLFHLLTLTGVEPEAYDVVFRATDDYSSSITIEEALRPTTILALRANGTLLSEIRGQEGGFRIVVPCKWGYKWVTHVEEIEVVDYDYKGRWEDFGFSDEAGMPNCILPSTTPVFQTFNVAFEKREFKVEAFTNITIQEFRFNYLQKELKFNVAVLSDTTGFVDLTVGEDLLKGLFTVFLNEEAVSIAETTVTKITFLYMIFPEGFHTVKIVGTESFGSVPKIVAEFNQTAFVGELTIFDASKSVDDGTIVSYKWNFGDGTSGNSAIVSHPYTVEGTYQVSLNVTDDDGLSNLATFTVTVERQPEYINVGKESAYVAILGTVSAVIFGGLATTLIILFLRRKTRTENELDKASKQNLVRASREVSTTQRNNSFI